MEIKLESIQDIRHFGNNWSTIYEENKALDTVTNAKVIISAKLLSDYLKELSDKEDKLLSEYFVLKYNFIEEWIENVIETVEDKSEEEIRRNCLEEVKEELANLKSEEYNFN